MRNKPKYLWTLSIVIGLLALAALLMASGGVINLFSTNLVSSLAATGGRWEPSSAAGSTWATSFAILNPLQSYVTAWNGSSWNSPQLMAPPNGFSAVDFNLAYDSSQSRFVFATVDNFAAGSVWYGSSSDSSGASWTFDQTAVFAGNFSGGIGWDYPSIAVDASGRIIIGAVKTNHNGPGVVVGYFAAVSTNHGASFSVPSCVAGSDPACSSSTGGSSPGANGRVVAAGSTFHAFIPTLNAAPINLPYLVQRWQSSDGVSWSGPNSIGMGSFGAPLNNTPPGSTVLYYAPLLAATGNANGVWATAFQVNNSGFNNVVICTSTFGCAFVNLTAEDDEFLAGVSVSTDNAYWVSLTAYSSNDGMRQLPLISQAFYLPPPSGEIGARVNSDIDPATWNVSGPGGGFVGGRCTVTCLAAGDFASIASNPYAGASVPFLDGSASPNQMRQMFVVDPQSQSNVPNFRPNFVPIANGADISYMGAPVPPACYGMNPALRSVAMAAR